jgi:hypothetical protein
MESLDDSLFTLPNDAFIHRGLKNPVPTYRHFLVTSIVHHGGIDLEDENLDRVGFVLPP